LKQLIYILAFALILDFFAPDVSLSQGTHGTRILERVAGKSPEVGVESQVVQGELVYSEFDYVRQKAARLLEPVKVTRKKTIPAGTILEGYLGKKGEHYCLFNATTVLGLIPRAGWFCLVPGRDQKFVTLNTLAEDAWGVSSKALKVKPAFEWTYQSISADLASEHGLGGLYRKEIVYQGAAGGILRLLYREYTNDLVRPAFIQELTYDYSGAESLRVAVKGVRLEVFEAGNSGIRYLVTRGFDEVP
jgi:hypothetical protein